MFTFYFNLHITSDVNSHSSEINDLLTNLANEYGFLTKSSQKFLRRAIEINVLEQRTFSFGDFDYSQPNFRQKILRFRRSIEVVQKSVPCFYKIKGTKLPLDSHRLTNGDMGGSEEFFDILSVLQSQPPAIHDIKIQFESKLHDGLIKKGATMDPRNKSIKVDIPKFDFNMTIKVLTYPKTTQIDVSCTYRPILYGPAGLFDLFEILNNVSNYLQGLGGVELPRVGTWVITHYHFGKDGTQELNGERFHYSVSDVLGAFAKFYSKTMPDGRTIARVEEIRTPRRNIIDEIFVSART